MSMKLNSILCTGLAFFSILSMNISRAAESDKGPKFKDPSFVPPKEEKIKESAPNAFRILYIGNSITRHGICRDPLKWEHVSGMAASSEENDFAHRLAAFIQKTMPERKVELYFDSVNKLREYGKLPNAPGGKKMPMPHLVVVQTGEHEGPGKSKEEVAKIYEEKLIKPVYDLKPRPLILCTGLWYVANKPYCGWVKEINEAYKSVCDKYGIPFVSVESFATDPSCRGWGQHPGVKWHPNDKGMKGYADSLFKAYETIKDKKNLATPEKQNSALPQVIVPDFSKSELDLPNLKLNKKDWILSENILKTSNASERMIRFSFGERDWQDYELEFRVKRIKLNPKDQHFGVFLRCDGEKSAVDSSVRIYSRGGAILLQEHVGGKETRHSQIGNFKLMENGEDSPWVSFRISVVGKNLKVYVDNKFAGGVNDLLPAKGEIIFYAYNLDLWLDNLKVLLMKKSDSSSVSAPVRNILHNSSFEQSTLDKLPDYWGCLHWGLLDPYWILHFNDWIESYRVDESESFDGKRSMRINNPFDKPDSSGLLLRSVNIGSKANKKYKFSAYLKSRPSGMKVNFNGKEIVLSEEWKRYSVDFLNNGQSIYNDMINVYPLSKGTFWIDAAQLEEGDSITPYHRSFERQPLQIQEGNEEKVISEVPRISPPFIDKSIVLDGRLDDPVWANLEKLELVSTNGQPAQEKTEASLWYNNEGIYIGIKCMDENAAGNECKITKREGCVWNDPSIELFIDPKLTRNYYYQLAFNQKGTQYDAFCGDISWNGHWRVATNIDQNGKFWTAEAFLPFGEMGIDKSSGNIWGLNIYRNNKNKKEYNCWSPTFAGYHVPERFGQICLDRKILDNYCFDCVKAEFIRGREENVLLSVDMLNDSGEKGEYLLEANLESVSDKGVVKFKNKFDLANGEKRCVELGKVSGKPDEKYNLQLNLYSPDGKKIYYSANKYLEMPSYFRMLPQYRLYTKEKTILLRAWFNMNEESLKKAALALSICKTDGDSIVKKDISALHREMDLNLEIGNLPQGKYCIVAELKNDSGKTLAVVKQDFQKLPPKAYEVKIDHIDRMVVVDGKPFMPLGFAWEGELTKGVMEYLSKNGSNAISFYPNFNYKKTQDVLDNAARLGMKIKISISAKDKKNSVKFIEHFKEHPAVLAWDVFDEVFTGKWGRENYAYISETCADLKKLDPYHPVYINENQYGLTYLRNKNLEFPGDIVSIDYYAWTPSGNFPVTGDYVRLMKLMGRNEGRPVWIYLLGAGYAFWASRDYTPAEQEYSTYTSIINGGSGIFYFASHPKSISQWKRIKRLLSELTELTPVIGSHENAPAIKCAAPSIEFLVKKSENAIYLIAVNSSKQPVNARFDLSSCNLPAGASSEVLFEKRSSEIKDNILNDRFDGFQRHVYRIPVK